MTTDRTSSARPEEEGGPRRLPDFDHYQERALVTARFPDVGGQRCVYPALGLANEAGEVLGKIKKLFRDRGGEVTPEFRQELKQELGDVYWYLAVLADAFDLRASEVAEANLDKLADRAERGVIRGEGDHR
jgi:NTP pyrophosphatase (non-canonical NTP hydrolase)